MVHWPFPSCCWVDFLWITCKSKCLQCYSLKLPRNVKSCCPFLASNRGDVKMIMFLFLQNNTKVVVMGAAYFVVQLCIWGLSGKSVGRLRKYKYVKVPLCINNYNYYYNGAVAQSTWLFLILTPAQSNCRTTANLPALSCSNVSQEVDQFSTFCNKHPLLKFIAHDPNRKSSSLNDIIFLA